MSRYPSLTKTVLALILTFGAAASVGAQDPTKTGYCTGVPFSLTASDAKVHFAIDDVSGAPATNVTLRLYNGDGTLVVGKKVVALPAGRTVTLSYQGSGLLRAQATYDWPTSASARRAAVSSVEMIELGVKLIIPVSCTVQDNIGR